MRLDHHREDNAVPQITVEARDLSGGIAIVVRAPEVVVQPSQQDALRHAVDIGVTEAPEVQGCCKLWDRLLRLAHVLHSVLSGSGARGLVDLLRHSRQGPEGLRSDAAQQEDLDRLEDDREPSLNALGEEDLLNLPPGDPRLNALLIAQELLGREEVLGTYRREQGSMLLEEVEELLVELNRLGDACHLFALLLVPTVTAPGRVLVGVPSPLVATANRLDLLWYLLARQELDHLVDVPPASQDQVLGELLERVFEHVPVHPLHQELCMGHVLSAVARHGLV
mmetsp:Transcript_97285/g.251668  ORF Transcript_97285/g.251668 Transcript_97285/m.251668 type:complete len:281 (+) Transcript_97285:3717-4559(+)